MEKGRKIIKGFTGTKQTVPVKTPEEEDIRAYNIGNSNYAQHPIQPWDIWKEYKLDPWEADIIKRVLRTKEGDSRIMDFEKIIHVCKFKISLLKEEEDLKNG